MPTTRCRRCGPGSRSARWSARLGDVFGQTVNIASRLTSVARTGSVLVDEGMYEALEGDDRFTLSPRRPVSVRGYHHLRSWRLRHSG